MGCVDHRYPIVKRCYPLFRSESPEITLLFVLRLVIVVSVFVRASSAESIEPLGDEENFGVSSRSNPPPIAVVLSSPGSDPGAEQCLIDYLGSPGSPVSLRGADAFRKNVFPWFQPSTMPRTSDELRGQLASELLRRKIEELGVRYVIAVTGSTSHGLDSGPMLFGGGAFFGLATMPKQSNYVAEVWDLVAGTAAGQLEGSASGTTVMPAFILPIPIIASTRSNACAELANEVLEFFASVEPR